MGPPSDETKNYDGIVGPFATFDINSSGEVPSEQRIEREGVGVDPLRRGLILLYLVHLDLGFSRHSQEDRVVRDPDEILMGLRGPPEDQVELFPRDLVELAFPVHEKDVVRLVALTEGATVPVLVDTVVRLSFAIG